MNNATQQIVNKAWNFAHVPRVSYMACTEQFSAVSAELKGRA